MGLTYLVLHFLMDVTDLLGTKVYVKVPSWLARYFLPFTTALFIHFGPQNLKPFDSWSDAASYICVSL